MCRCNVYGVFSSNRTPASGNRSFSWISGFPKPTVRAKLVRITGKYESTGANAASGVTQFVNIKTANNCNRVIRSGKKTPPTGPLKQKRTAQASLLAAKNFFYFPFHVATHIRDHAVSPTEATTTPRPPLSRLWPRRERCRVTLHACVGGVAALKERGRARSRCTNI